MTDNTQGFVVPRDRWPDVRVPRPLLTPHDLHPEENSMPNAGAPHPRILGDGDERIAANAFETLARHLPAGLDPGTPIAMRTHEVARSTQRLGIGQSDQIAAATRDQIDRWLAE